MEMSEVTPMRPPNPVTKKARKSTGLPVRLPGAPRWSNGWAWYGKPYDAKVYLTVSRLEVSLLALCDCDRFFTFSPYLYEDRLRGICRM